MNDLAAPKVTMSDSGSASREPAARLEQPQENLAGRAAVPPTGEHTGRFLTKSGIRGKGLA